MGLYLAVLFWLNHIGMPVIQAEHGLSFVEQQVVGSRNVSCRAGFDGCFGGLNYQIEHHLYPIVRGRAYVSFARSIACLITFPHSGSGASLTA